MKKLLAFWVFLGCLGIAGAQVPGFGGGNTQGTGEFSGTVIDKQTGLPLEFATIAVLRGRTERTTEGAVTDEKGRFRIKKIRKGSYFLEISFLGYETQKLGPFEMVEEDQKIKLGNIPLQLSSRDLEQVEVVAEKRLIESRIDRLIYNAEIDASNQGGTASDVLRKVPGVNVDLDGNVSLRGSSQIQVLINDKPSSIMASSVAEAMRMIPADNIEKVEVITSPSARYDAEGTAGIINIITKKKRIEGLSGSVFSTAGNRQSALGSNMTFRVGDFGINANVGGFYFGAPGDFELETRYKNGEEIRLQQSGDNRLRGGGGYGQVGFDYDFNSKNNLNANVRLNRNRFVTSNTLDFRTAIGNGDLIPVFTNEGLTTTDRLGMDWNVSYVRKFAKDKQKLSFLFQYSPDNRDNNYERDQFLPDGQAFFREKSDNFGINRETTVQLDYEHPITKTIQFETGAKAIVRDIGSDFFYFTDAFPFSGFTFDALRSNGFTYGQDVAAGYGQISAFLKNKWGIKMGMRYEHTFIDGFYNEINEPIRNDYPNLLPSATVSYNFDNGTSARLSYNQRISRPGLFFLNPFVNAVDPQNISQGNPALGAELSSNYEVGYNWFKGLHSLNLALYHRRTVDGIETVREVLGEDILFSTYQNIGKRNISGLSLSGNYNNALKQIIGANVNFYYFDVSNQANPEQAFKGVAYDVSAFASIDVKNGYGIQFFGLLRGPTITFQGLQQSWYYYNMSAKKDVKGKQGSISLGLDNFLTPRIGLESNFEDVNFVNRSLINFRAFGARVSFNYRFGKMTFGQNRNRGVKNTDLKAGEEQQGGGLPMGM
jgi:ferric enterobactin receptor